MKKTSLTTATQPPHSAEKVTIINHIARGGKPVKLTITRTQKCVKENEREDGNGGSYEDRYIDDAYVVIKFSDPLPSFPNHVGRIRINRGVGWWQQVENKRIGDSKEEILTLTTEEKIILYNAMYERLLPWISPEDEAYIERYENAIPSWIIRTRKESFKHGRLSDLDENDYEDYEVDPVLEEAKCRFPERLGLSKLGAQFAAAAVRKKLGAAILEARKAAGLTTRQLAERADTPKSNISRIEGGRDNATIDTYGKLAAALGLNISIAPKQD